MQKSWADEVWERMTRGKYYSIRDLSNLTGQQRSAVADVLQFLTKFGFVNRMGADEPIFMRSAAQFSPEETIKLLQCVAAP
jgi:hypothetical protein